MLGVEVEVGEEEEETGACTLWQCTTHQLALPLARPPRITYHRGTHRLGETSGVEVGTLL